MFIITACVRICTYIHYDHYNKIYSVLTFSKIGKSKILTWILEVRWMALAMKTSFAQFILNITLVIIGQSFLIALIASDLPKLDV